MKKDFYFKSEMEISQKAFWREVEAAKQIQTSLMPINKKINGYEISATMIPVEEIGGDYYDIITTKYEGRWVAVGDVAGHGVDASLIMMMAQTSIYSVLNNSRVLKPSKVINEVNLILRENLTRLNNRKYMTLSLLNMHDDHFIFAGKHQDIIKLNAIDGSIEELSAKGTWIGIMDNIKHFLSDVKVPIEKDDVILLFTDGITESINDKGEMYGQDRLKEALSLYYTYPAEEIVERIIEDIFNFVTKQTDDMTLIIIKKL